MDELCAKLERKLGRFGTMGQDAPAHPITRFENAHGRAGAVQLPGCGQARRARADNKNIRGSGYR